MSSLVLFDIDGTLLATGGLGVRAMEDAGRELFGPAFTSEGIEYSGRLDPLIIADLFRANGVRPSAGLNEKFRSVFGAHLDRRIAAATSCRSLPGVTALVDVLAGESMPTIGLLTGNFPETGRRKLIACGLDPDRFCVNAWGDDCPDDPPARDQLPRVAFRRFLERHRRSVDPTAVTIIGDTPHDVACARVNGCRSIAVATGRFSVAQLAAAGADHALPDLSDTGGVLTLLGLASVAANRQGA